MLNKFLKIKFKWQDRLNGLLSMCQLGIFIALIIAFTALSSCKSNNSQSNHQIPISVIKVVAQDTPVTIEFVGKTESSHQVEIRARVNGFLEKIAYTEGSLVHAGEVLFQIDPKPFRAQLDAEEAALVQQKAQLKTAKANLARIKPLVRLDALSQKDLDDATGREESTAASVEISKANVENAKLNLGYTTISTPITGLSSYARVREGTYIGRENSLLTYVYQIDPMWVKFSVSENDVLQYRGESHRGQFTVPKNQAYEIEVVLADGTIYSERGKLTFTDAEYNHQTGTFLVRATIPNPKDLLRPGQFLRIHLLGGIRPHAILVPQQAVFEGAHGHFVWIVDKDSKAQTRNVEVGPQHGKEWFITKGLSPGDIVITEGMMKLTAGMTVNAETSSETK